MIENLTERRKDSDDIGGDSTIDEAEKDLFGR